MSNQAIANRLKLFAQAEADARIAMLLREAALHIESQDQALSEVREELAREEAERMKLEDALHASKAHVEQALRTLQAAWCPPVELGRDLAPHINLMAGHGDPDYLRKNGNSIRHIDCREAAPRKTRSTK